MASFKTYQNIDPEEVMRFINSYQKDLYPSAPSHDYTDILEQQQKQDSESRQYDFQSKVADKLKDAPDEQSALQAVLDAAKETGQVDKYLNFKEKLDDNELESQLKDLGVLNNEDDIRTGAKKAYLTHGKIKEALAIEKQGRGQIVNRKDGVYLVDPLSGSIQKLAGMSSDDSGVGGNEIITETPDEAEADGYKLNVYPNTKAGHARAMQDTLIGGKRYSTMAEAQAARLARENASNNKKDSGGPSLWDSILNSAASLINGGASSKPSNAPYTRSELEAMGYKRVGNQYIKVK